LKLLWTISYNLLIIMLSTWASKYLAVIAVNIYEWMALDSWVFGKDFDRTFVWFEVFKDAILAVSGIDSIHIRF
jgi:hypothetical protein